MFRFFPIFSYFQPLYQFQKLWRHDEYYQTRWSIFFNIFWIVHHFVKKLGQLLDIVMGNTFKKKFRSSHQRCSIEKGVLRNFIKFTGKHMCESLFFNKVTGLKFLRTPFLQNTFGRLLLKVWMAWMTSSTRTTVHQKQMG